MDWTNLYKNRTGSWLRGNLHTHSGEGMTQEEIFKAYDALGYDFLCISDHRKLTMPRPPAGCRMLALPGFEWNSKTGDHMTLISFDFPTLLRCTRTQEPDKALKRIKGRPVIMVMNHPNARATPHYSRETLDERSPAATGLEIYNGSAEFGTGMALATEKWDYLLSRRRLVLGFASDDAHRPKHVGQAWIMVRSRFRTARSLFRAIQSGNFYCSTGASFSEIRRDGSRIAIESPDAQEIWAIGEWGARVDRIKGNRMVFDFDVHPSRYIRFAAFGHGAAMAWTQPFLREPFIEDRRFSPFIRHWSVSSLLAKPLAEVTAADAGRPDLRWRPLAAMTAPDGFVNVSAIHGRAHGIAWLSAEITVAKAGAWIAALGHDGGARLFVDGRLLLDQPVRSNPAIPDRSKTRVRLSRGTHRVQVALDTDHGLGQGIFLRFILPGKAPRRPVFPLASKPGI